MGEGSKNGRKIVPEHVWDITTEPQQKTALIAVDVQGDFINGSLGGQTPEAVQERQSVINPLLQYSQNADLTVASRDWHPPNHMSFSENPEFVDGSWPAHAVQGTPGAEIAPEIQKAADVVVSKGQDSNQEAYSAFEGTVETPRGPADLASYLRSQGITNVIVGGIATDYCVRATALDAQKAGFNVSFAQDASAGVAPETSQAATQEMQQAGVVPTTLPQNQVVSSWVDNPEPLEGNHKLKWLPGFPGKGFVWSGNDAPPAVYTWNTEEAGRPNHQDTLEHHYIPYREMKTPFEIGEDGTVTVPKEWEPTFNSTVGFNLADLSRVDPNLRFHPESEWEEPAWDISA